MYFVTRLLISTNWKSDSYNSILVIVDKLTNMINYELVIVIINTPGLAKVILNVVVWHHGLLNSIVSDKSSLFISKFWSSFCYFLDIKRQLSTAFYLQINGQTKEQNSTIETYFELLSTLSKITELSFH